LLLLFWLCLRLLLRLLLLLFWLCRRLLLCRRKGCRVAQASNQTATQKEAG
jgi:hypothetical protein